jgi:hypothetical protein
MIQELIAPVDCVDAVNPPGICPGISVIPAATENDVADPGQITFVPVILHEGESLRSS